MTLPFATPPRPAARAVPAERLFIALWPDEAVRARLAGAQAPLKGHGRIVPAPNLHLTLLFLGSVAGERRGELTTLMRDAAGPAFDLVLDRPGHFAGSGVAWLGASAMPPQLPVLHGRLADAARRAGFRVERRAFRPHVTLARDCTRPPAQSPPETIAWHVDQLALVRSHLERGGSRYEVIARVRLGARGAG